MNALLDRPLLVFVLAFAGLWLATYLGAHVFGKRMLLTDTVRDDFATVRATALTLSGLIIGFTFSMAIGRYEQRKDYEEAEANAIGTEYVRSDLVADGTDAAVIRSLLLSYLDRRMASYVARDPAQSRQIEIDTVHMQNELWSTVGRLGTTQPTAIGSLVVNGMNEVLNSRGYAHAASQNRIPLAAWILMAATALIAHTLIGCGAQNRKSESLLLAVLPFVVAIAFLLIADIDSPRSGIIRVIPLNLTALAQELRAQGTP